MQKHTSVQGTLFRFFLILGVGLGVVFIPARTAHAVINPGCTIDSGFYYGIVTSTADSNDPGTLRGEIVCGGINTIYFSESVWNSTITLSLGEIPINRSVNIRGIDFAPVTISGNHASRIFNISGPNTVTLENLILTEGQDGYDTPTKAGIARGGALYIGESAVTIFQVTLSNNHTIADQSEGGAIFIETGTVNIEASTFSGNSSTSMWSRGGAIYNGTGTVSVIKSTFTGNSASGSSGGNGGAIYNAGNLTLNNDTFVSNFVSTPGGRTLFNNAAGYTTNVSNTFIAGSGAGGNCGGADFTSSANNISDDLTCGAGFTFQTLADLNLGTLGYYGGMTQTIPLLTGSAAIDMVPFIDPTTPPPCYWDTDQRGVMRNVGGTCDIGAFEWDEPVPAVIIAGSVPTNGAILPAGINTLKVVFNRDVFSALATSNYLLVEAGSNGIIDTQSCRDAFIISISFIPSLPGDDIFIPINSLSYEISTYTITANINGGIPLPNGTYKLFVCGTTSIDDGYGLKLNYGYSDATIAFQVGLSSVKAPATGFAPNRVSPLPTQSTAYDNLGDLWLEIPSLGVKAPIVGVPMENGSWDVSWLGKDAGWLNGSAFPTWAGNSVLTGHVYDAFGKPGPFAGINRLWYGSQIIVHAWGGAYVYEVRSIMQVDPNNTSAMLKHQDLPWLTLVTCRGYNEASDSYKFRVLVRAVLVNVK